MARKISVFPSRARRHLAFGGDANEAPYERVMHVTLFDRLQGGCARMMTVKDARRERASLLDGVLVVEQFAHSPRQDVGGEGLGEVVDPLVEPAVMNDGVARVARHVQYR